MQILLICASTDKYSYEGYTLHRSMFEGEWSKSDLLHIKRDYVESFQAKHLSKIGVVHLDVTPEGQVTILDNIQGTNPLKTRKEINPAAAAKRAMRKVSGVPGAQPGSGHQQVQPTVVPPITPMGVFSGTPDMANS